MVIPLPVEEQCRGVLSEPQPNLQLLTGDAQVNEAMGYPMVQQWRVRSNLYKVKLSSITLSAGFSKVLKVLNAESSREELLSFILQYGSHYVSEALYGSELTCTIYFPSKKVQQQLWLQYQKETTDLGSRRELKSMPFITYLTGLLAVQRLSEDHLVSGVEIRCEEKGRCPSACHLCRRPGLEQPSPTPVLLEVTRIVPLYSLVQDNVTKAGAVSGPQSQPRQGRLTQIPPNPRLVSGGTRNHAVVSGVALEFPVGQEGILGKRGGAMEICVRRGGGAPECRFAGEIWLHPERTFPRPARLWPLPARAGRGSCCLCIAQARLAEER
ncbi:hypothetical protein COCON_G00161470 [Conger conger]|uniref:MACPF domain-containing protein n=1 Tax=Conger conger TaxID=82655 RepID=A0A9Q1DAT3_CONCO|nr:hypothetical protein COCON_G00161470 [Conger conger]